MILEEVTKLLGNDKSGHAVDHVLRVNDLSLKFAKLENANMEIVNLISLLHDVDDYKLFENSENLPNATRILEKINIDQETKNLVLSEIKSLGFSKYLKGIRPKTLEGKIVSDADMCDAIGAHGILRTFAFGLSKNRPFFEKDKFPLEGLTFLEYTKLNSNGVNHMFDKILKLKNLMFTESGKKEAINRHKFCVSFLRQYFKEENLDNWLDYLDRYLEDNNA